MKKKKNVSIRRRIQNIVFQVALAALLIDSAIGMLALSRQKNTAIEMQEASGDYATQKGEEAVLSQMKESMVNLTQSKVAIAEESLKKYQTYLDAFVFFTERLYQVGADYPARTVEPPDAANKGVPTMQRILRDKSVAYSDVEQEIGMLGNMETFFAPILKDSDGMVSTLYLVTESGFMLCYDKNSDLMDQTSQKEEYYDYSKTDWYALAKEADGPVLTDAYMDMFDRGLTVTYAAPFHDADGAFTGVLCMDLLVDTLNEVLLDVEIGDHSYAFLLDRHGNIIASQGKDTEGAAFENIITDTDSMAHDAAEVLLSGESGIVLTDAGIYYAFAPIALTGWIYAVHIESSDITAPIMEIDQTIEENTRQVQQDMKKDIFYINLLFTTVLVFICAAVLVGSRLFAGRITRPILHLKETASAISGGDLSHMAEVETEDEIGDLAKAFNHMTQSLQTYIDDLTKVTAEKERIGAELNVATNIQASMLPRLFPAFPERKEFDLAASMEPAKEVGGDFYDFFMVDDNHLALVIADVSGKGVPAALFMVIAKTLIKNAAQQGLSPKAVLERANVQLCDGNDAEMFVTVWIGILDIATGVLTCANAGHEYPALRRAEGQFELLKDRHGFVLAGMETARYQEYTIELQHGDSIFVYTDGVAEATDSSNELFGTDRMLAALNENPDVPPSGRIAVVRDAIETFVGEAEQFDDITMLSLNYR